MAILINENTSIIVQGVCTRKGQLLLADMLDYNSNVCAGVCYMNKQIKEVRGVPFYRHLADAVHDFSAINVSLIASSAYDVLNHAIEAMECGIKIIIIHTASIPLKDVMLIRQEAQKHQCLVLGPDSAGITHPDLGMVGSMGGIHALSIFKKGNFGVISRSNGLINELSIALKNNGLGISTAVSLGTEKIPFSDYVDIYKYFQEDDDTKAVILLGTAGGRMEEHFADYYSQLENPKAVVAFIAGRFVDDLQTGMSFGHISSIVEGGSGKPKYKIKKLEGVGVRVVDFISDIPQLLMQ